MALSSDLISQFVKFTKDDSKISNGSTVYGTASVIRDDNGNVVSTRVQLDGSDQYTPVTTTADVQDGERVTVLIKDHTATITGNISSPAARTDSVKEVDASITKLGTIMAHRVTAEDLSAVNAYIEKLKVIVADFESISTDDLAAINAQIESLEARIIKADHITAEDLDVINAEIESLKVNIGSFQGVSTENLEAANAEIENLKVYVGDFTYVSADVLTAIKATIKDLDVKKLNAEDADIKYADIGFANIGEAAIKKIFSDFAMIEDLFVDGAKISGELVAVTISADRIKARTLTLDKLVVRGSDGKYYQVNTDFTQLEGVTPIEEDQIHGSNIVAESITADKIRVKDLAAFGATIGSFIITKDAIYSAGKGTVNANTPGIYQDRDGQFAVGNNDSHLKFYKDADGTYKLSISADSIQIGSSKKTVETIVQEGLSSIEVGARNLIRNSTNMIFSDYGFESAAYTTALLGKAIVGKMVLDDGTVLSASRLIAIENDIAAIEESINEIQTVLDAIG